MDSAQRPAAAGSYMAWGFPPPGSLPALPTEVRTYLGGGFKLGAMRLGTSFRSVA